MAPACSSSVSAMEVLPAPAGPTSAIFLMPEVAYPIGGCSRIFIFGRPQGASPVPQSLLRGRTGGYLRSVPCGYQAAERHEEPACHERPQERKDSAPA